MLTEDVDQQGKISFFQRIEWLLDRKNHMPDEVAVFQEMAESKLSINATVRLSADNLTVGIVVFKRDYCFHGLCLRFRLGKMSGQLVCAVSNHPDL